MQPNVQIRRLRPCYGNSDGFYSDQKAGKVARLQKQNPPTRHTQLSTS